MSKVTRLLKVICPFHILFICSLSYADSPARLNSQNSQISGTINSNPLAKEQGYFEAYLGTSLPFLAQAGFSVIPHKNFFLETKAQSSLIFGYASLSAGFQYSFSQSKLRLGTGPAKGYYVTMDDRGSFLWAMSIYSCRQFSKPKKNLSWRAGCDLLYVKNEGSEFQKPWSITVPSFFIGIVYSPL